tara:strand:+ start:89 stop:277 length:189 start_codon:yes stop_codon:yes gene_type:complete
MEDKLELDPRILIKNLEITKLTQQVDSLKSQVIDLREQFSNIISDGECSVCGTTAPRMYQNK